MAFLAALWLPIVVSAVIVFVASSILHMVLPYHRSDYKKLPNEEPARAALRGTPPGLYMTPFCSQKEMKSPEAQARFQEGPVALISMYPNGQMNMGKLLGAWFGFLLLVSLFVAYAAYHTLPAGTHYLKVFRVVGTMAFLAYGLANISNGIWRGQPWSMVAKEIFDGLIYALLTAGAFGWRWPQA
jgi:hypothetical protein